jgi:isocitrate lyase
LQAVEDKWIADANLMLYGDAVKKAIEKSPDSTKLMREWDSKHAKLTHEECIELVKTMKLDVYWNWDTPRVREGFYRYQGGTKCAINRAVAYAPYADLIWMETKKPILAQAEEFSKGVLAVYPEQLLCYNLSPSFNW